MDNLISDLAGMAHPPPTPHISNPWKVKKLLTDNLDYSFGLLYGCKAKDILNPILGELRYNET